MSLNMKEQLFVMKMKNDAKFPGKFTCCFKIGMKSLTNFYPNTQKSKNVTL